jgi:hypothetical protein
MEVLKWLTLIRAVRLDFAQRFLEDHSDGNRLSGGAS